MTEFDKKCEILSELWMDFRDDKNFQDFIDYNDLGLPLANFIYEEIVSVSPKARIFIGETWDLFCAALGIDDSQDYNSLQHMFLEAGLT